MSLVRVLVQVNVLRRWPLLQTMRTDLDDFTTIEAGLLYLAGYQRARGETALPRKCEDEHLVALWSLMSCATPDGTPESDAAANTKWRSKLMDELARGRYAVAANFRHPSTMSVLNSLAAIYMTLASLIVVVLYIAIGLAVAIGHAPDWFRQLPSYGVVACIWLCGSTWLARFIEWRGKIGFFTRGRQFLGTLAGGSVLPLVVMLSVGMRISAYLFSKRDNTVWTRLAVTNRYRKTTSDGNSGPRKSRLSAVATTLARSLARRHGS